MTSVSVLEKELKAYEEMKEELLKKYRGKVVAIKDGKLLGVYESEEDAFKDILEKHGLVPILIKRVVDKEKPEEIPAYSYGLLGVVLTE